MDFYQSLPLLVLGIVFLLIAFRQIGNFTLAIWQIMLAGAIIVMLAGNISFKEALLSINLDVMLFLFGMFIIGCALEESGYLAHLSYHYFKRAKTLDLLLLFILFGVGIGSAFLMNDTIAIIGTPIMLLLARAHKIQAKVLLLALAFAVTIGSVMSPIGNPQNLLIALETNMHGPFVVFLRYLFVPTMLNLLVTYLVLRFFYKDEFHAMPLKHSEEPIKDKHLATIAKYSLFLVILLIVIKIALVSFSSSFEFRLTYIALIGAAPLVFASKKRWHLIKSIDWHTLVFFAALFVLMQAVWNTGFFQHIIDPSWAHSIPAIFLVSILLSQLISNVPLVALYLPLLIHSQAPGTTYIALAAASTIAGNLFILGAASTVIIIQNAEKKSKQTITFWEFARIGIPLTIINSLVYVGYLMLVF